MNPALSLPLLLAALVAGSGTAASTPGEAPAASAPRNVILVIGDGMDDQQVTIARNYLQGAAGRLLLDQLPVRGASQVLTTQDQVDGKPLYVADSANTATSMASGIVTSRGRLGTTPGTDRPVPTIAELAVAAGYRAGIVTTASVTDATPAAFAAHINLRYCENPERMEEVVFSGIYLGSCAQHMKRNGGGGSIARQLAESDLQVILGGGRKHFAPAAEGTSTSVLEVARQRGFHTVASAAELAGTDAGQRLLGLFSAGTLPVRLRGEDGRGAEAARPSLLNQVHAYLGEVTLPAVMDCEPNPDFAGLPSLREMTDAALRHLAHDNPRGFFLLVESASIDKQSHERKPCGAIGEVAQLEEALASALAFAAQQPRTLVIVTADHAQAAQLVPFESLFASYPVPVYTPGQLARIRTPEGGHLAVNYATTNFAMEEHTGAAVPVYANSEGSGRVPPFLQQPQLFGIMRDYLGLGGE